MITAVLVTVGNNYIPTCIEEFTTRVDISDPQEVDMCASECMGQYLEMHEDIYHGSCPDVSWDEFVDACYYMIEEVVENEF